MNARTEKSAQGSACFTLVFSVLTPKKNVFSLRTCEHIHIFIILLVPPDHDRICGTMDFGVRAFKMFIKSYDICYIVWQGENEMKKSCITRKEPEQILTESKHEDNLLSTGIVISLNESPRELRKKEAGKPLYLTRYE
jgi:hypothetical protein